MKTLFIIIFICLYSIFATANDAGTINNTLDNKQIPITISDELIQNNIQEVFSEKNEFTISSIVLEYSFDVSSSELNKELKKYINKKYGLRGIKKLIFDLESFFRKQFLWVNIIIPEQDLSLGKLRLIALEPKLSNIYSNINADTRYSKNKIKDYVNDQIKTDQPISMFQMSNAIKSLNHIHGIKAAGVIQKSKSPQSSDFSVIIEPEQLVKATAIIDNFGTKAIGTERARININTNSLFSQGEKIDASFMKTEEMEYYSLGLSYPLGFSNYSLKLNANNMNYSLGQPFEALKAKGDSQNYSIGLNKKFFNNDSVMSYDLDYIDRNFKNKTIAGEASDKSINAILFGLTYEFTDSILGSDAKNLINITYTNGRLDLSDNSANLISDQNSSKKHGNFKKAGFYLTRLQKLNSFSKSYLKFNMRGQVSFDNLDNSEKIFLGGPYGIRAYPVAEGMGDRGIIVNLEWHQLLSQSLESYYFYDVGKIKINHHTWSGWNSDNPQLPNSYTLQGAGLGIIYRPSYINNAYIDLNYAHKIGTNGGQSSSNKDNDQSSRKSRLWVNFVKEF